MPRSKNIKTAEKVRFAEAEERVAELERHAQVLVTSLVELDAVRAALVSTYLKAVLTSTELRKKLHALKKM